MAIEDILNDVVRYHYDDSEIDHNYDRLRMSFKAKGFPYRELLKSKTLGTAKYLMVELNDGSGVVLITDLDSNRTFETKVEEASAERTAQQIRDFITS